MVHINDNRKIKLTCTIDQVSLKQWALKQDHWKPKLLIPPRSLWQTLEKKSCTSPKIFLCAQKSESDPRKHPQVLMQSRSPGQLPTATSYVTPSISALYHKNHRLLALAYGPPTKTTHCKSLQSVSRKIRKLGRNGRMIDTKNVEMPRSLHKLHQWIHKSRMSKLKLDCSLSSK